VLEVGAELAVELLISAWIVGREEPRSIPRRLGLGQPVEAVDLGQLSVDKVMSRHPHLDVDASQVVEVGVASPLMEIDPAALIESDPGLDLGS
jgi:hypothetical protein